MSSLFTGFARASRPVYRRTAYAAVGLSAGLTAYIHDKEGITTNLAALRDVLRESYTLHADETKLAPYFSEPGTSTPLGLDKATAVQHPPVISPSTAPDLAIVGVGVRTVSFLSFKVYSAAAYVNDYTLKRLRTVPGWTSYDPAQMATEGEKLVQSVLDVPTAMAIRIVPVRNTDFNHLRDGFTRTLLQRLKEARVEGKVTEKDEIGINEGLQRLKAAFPLGSVPKGKELLVVRSPDSVLYLEYEGNIVGTVPNKWIADNMILAYFSKTPISPPLRDSAAEGFNQYYKMAWYAPK